MFDFFNFFFIFHVRSFYLFHPLVILVILDCLLCQPTGDYSQKLAIKGKAAPFTVKLNKGDCPRHNKQIN